MATLRDQAARRRMELNPLTTSLNAVPPPHQTPVSALSTQSSLSTQYGYNPQQYTPVSAVRQYNPQQWTSSSSVTPDSATQFSGRPQDLEVVVPAPPPYSPPRSNRASMILADDPASGISPATRSSPSPNPNVYRSSPEPASNPIFPPPPNFRNRAGSNDRSQPLFNISFARRPAPEAPRISPDLNRVHASSSRWPTPISPETGINREYASISRRPAPISSEISREYASSSRRPAPISTEAPHIGDDLLQLSDSRPPASRRAVSTGAISTPSSATYHRSSTSRWEPGMPLPPPPPGPPPPTSRSQSMSRTPDRVTSPPTRRPGPISNLGPVPPTPAGWVDEDLSGDVSGRGRSPNTGLHIDTSSVGSSTVVDSSNSGSSSSGLARQHAVRGEPKSIRERRNESKTRRATDEPSNNPWAESITPSDILVPSTIELGRRQTITKSTPRSARSQQGETPRSAASASQHNTPVQLQPNTAGTAGTTSRGSTPRPLLSSSRPEAPTPPFSPNQIKNAFTDGSPSIPPKALPTPPPQSRLALESPARPVSHILHMPNNENVKFAPLVPSRPNSRQSNPSQMSQISPVEQFARAAIERHQAFAQNEAAANTDGERVRIFADFIVTESRLRRERYAAAIDGMGLEILELTRDLFRPYSAPRREASLQRDPSVRRDSSMSRSSAWTPESSTGPRSPAPRSHRGSIMAALHDGPQLQSQSEPTSGSGQASPAIRPESTWWTGYMPSLSPIPSMSVSEALDGSDSRGRPSSRWWEVSQGGRSDGTPSMKLERSKRESKYMGMPRELREALQYANGDAPPNNGKGIDITSPSEMQSYGTEEYPPEKVGWHEQDLSSPQQPTRSPAPFSPAPFTPNPNHLDVSRLVTLPPSYPRHHPAVNNNHPDLTSIRTIVRTLSDFTEVEATKARYIASSIEIREDLAAFTSKRRNSLRLNIQREIAAGTMTYADAAKVEAEALATEQEKEKEASKEEFDLFQSQVVGPINDLLMDRVNRATELFTQLRSKLFVDAQEQSPNLTQEEGDEQPELLEKLTLLKWIFEAREQLHRELFDLLSDRNNRYRDMIITPYRLASNTDKVLSVSAFFAQDTGKRKLEFEQEVLKRTEEFMDIIEENVVRGVEVQLSAFWDIAPSLSRITDKIPEDLNGFLCQIPPSEYEENPSYYEFPMQYLYSLLAHCEKSTYQFIESQTNLLCLLHEVKSGVTVANCRLMKTQRVQQGEEEDLVERELRDVEADEEARLTDDLKEKVRCVEELWSSALGDELKTVKEKIVGFLVQQGGWEDDE